MANCLLLLNDGSSNLLLNDGSSKLLLNDDSCGAPDQGGGGAGVGKSKQVGVSIYDVDQSIPPKKHLFPEWSFEIRGTLIQEIKTEFESVARFKLQQKSKKFKVGAETFMIKEKVLEALARFRTPQYHEMYLKARFKIPQIVSEWESKWNYDKIINLLEKYTKIIDPHNTIKSFDFEEDHDAWKVMTERETTAFTHSSSWIGHVIYDSDTQQMSITMGGKRYLFCGIPDRVYDGFEGSPSKGEFYWREIRQLYDC